MHVPLVLSLTEVPGGAPGGLPSAQHKHTPHLLCYHIVKFINCLNAVTSYTIVYRSGLLE